MKIRTTALSDVYLYRREGALFTVVLSASINHFQDGNHSLFNDTLNTVCLRLCVVGHMVKYHSDSEKEICCRNMGSLSEYQQGLFYMHHRTDRISHTTAL